MVSVSAPLQKTKSKTIFLGYGKYDAATNMAIDEAMQEYSQKNNVTLIRFYDFQHKSIILGAFDNPDCLKLENSSGVDITRRKSGGRPIYISANVLCYSISVPKENNTGQENTPSEVHKMYGNLAADGIAKVAGIDRSELTLPRTSSIRFRENPIAGHAQSWLMGKSMLYHGIIVVAPWDIAEIDNLWKLNENELQRIAALPSVIGISKNKLNGIDETKKELVKAILESVSGGEFEIDSENKNMKEILERARDLSMETYRKGSWIFAPHETRIQNVPFCILWEEDQKPQKKKDDTH